MINIRVNIRVNIGNEISMKTLDNKTDIAGHTTNESCLIAGDVSNILMQQDEDVIVFTKQFIKEKKNCA